MSFEDLQKLKAELGTKLYKEAYFGTKGVKQTNFKRLNKNRPREASSKVKPSMLSVKQKQKNIKIKEKEKLKKMLKKAKSDVEANKIKYLIRRLENQETERLRREKAQAKMTEERREQIQALNEGKKPHYKSKFERKVGDVIDKYEELKSSGKLMKFIEKKQKKNNRKYKKQFENDGS
ncbi:UNVERIFIED_CONTAM: hypothetical protein PYX00_003297 [Menopon gallinae]|uniref:rRNA biogenesis protein RRP36 n=1 Tax=Menopon gallinae TaxID=328185 RepID=A0AAW2I143_9NEOP